MATKLYTNDIDKTIDWGGDATTGGLPVSGEKVQKFIKDTLAKKFGFLYYDKDGKPEPYDGRIPIAEHTATQKYLIFADEADFAEWGTNPDQKKSIILYSFDAPAPATIELNTRTSRNSTILFADKDDQTISLEYSIKQSNGEAGGGRMVLDISFTNGNNINNRPQQDLGILNTDGTAGTFSIDHFGEYLLEGTNIVKFTFTSLEYNISRSIDFQLNVINFAVSSTFDYTRCVNLNEGYLDFDITCQAQGQKYVRMYVDGQNVFGYLNESDTKGNGKYIGGDTSITFNVAEYLLFDNFKDTWAKVGQHNIQFYCYIQNSDGTEIYSKTLYYDFVITEDGMNNEYFILFNKEVDRGNIIGQDDTIVVNAEQYGEINVDFGVCSNTGMGNTGSGKILVKIDLLDSSNNEVYSTAKELDNSEIATFNYTIEISDDLKLKLSIEGGSTTKVSEISVDVKESSANIGKITQGLLLELRALNRSNSEPIETRDVWQYERQRINQEPEIIKAKFNNVLWNDQCGWVDNALVLDNATVEIPMNIFNNMSITNGLTFEIDFETANVQDDDAVIMEYGDPSSAYICIKACNAEMKSNTGKSLTTNYKDNSRQKIQFIWAGNNESTNDMPHLYYLVVNGILDRVVKFDDTVTGGASSFIIGNTTGEATVKIYSIRLYNKALSLDNCISNYIADSGSLVLSKYNKNNVYDDNNKISVSQMLATGVPVMTIFGDITNSICKLFNKKTNVPVDVLYEDPIDKQFNFFAADCWMSNQGTSSMNYPRRNLRLYFNKVTDGNTLRGYGDDENYKYNTRVYPGLTDMTTIHKIQAREVEDPFNVVVNDVTYQPLCNKKWQIEKSGALKSVKDSAKESESGGIIKNLMCRLTDAEKARRMWHSGIKLYKRSQVKGNDGEPIDDYEYKKVKDFNSELIKDGVFKGCYVYGGYTHFKDKDLYTDRWTIKCDYAESSMTHNAGVGRLWGSVMENVEIPSGGYIYKIDPETGESSQFQTKNACRTSAQTVAHEYESNTGIQYGDIRTSCDGRPIVIVNYPRKRDENNKIILGEWGEPIFLGLHNIMTDKGSTPLFGFEDLKDDNGKVIFDASKCECWECLQNGSSLAQMYDMRTDDADGSTVAWNDDPDTKIETDRLIWKTYEARWPDNDNWNLTKTNNLETVIRFVNFCKDAVNVTVAGKDAYNISDYTQIIFDETGDYSEAEIAQNPSNIRNLIKQQNPSIINTNLWNGKIYIEEPAKSYKDKTSKFYKTDDAGNYVLNEDKTYQFLDYNDDNDKAKLLKLVRGTIWYKITFGQGAAATVSSTSALSPIYSEDATEEIRLRNIDEVMHSDTPTIYSQELDYSDVSYEEVPDNQIVANQGNKYFYYDSSYDRGDISKTVNQAKLTDEVYSGLVYTFDGKRVNAEGEKVNEDAWVRAYLTRSGTNSFTYVNEMGDTTTFVGGVNGEGFEEEKCSGNVGTAGTSFKGKTKLEYFSDKKYEHFDVWKLAAYYIYLMRFAAVDQVIKNTMMTTEDGQHYYFINYDNDTILGVRNDGHLVFDWQIDRNSYDKTGNSYAYAGFSSVLWNCLEADEDFMNKVQIVANAMVNSGVLTYDIALDMFNNKQSGTWSERLYNNSEMYKYIGTFNDMDNKGTSKYNPYQNSNYLPFLQGSRASHREWWLRHRFDYYDSKWSAGEYANSFLKVYFNELSASRTNAKEIIRLESASKFYYTIISNTRQLLCKIDDKDDNNLSPNAFVELAANKTGVVKTQESLMIGDPLKILGAHKAKMIDLSASKQQMTSELVFDNSGGAWDSNSLKKLIIGGDNDSSCGVQAIQGLDKLTSLEELNIRGCNALATPDISKLLSLKKYDARATRINSFEPSVGVHMTEVYLPTTIKTLKLVNAKFDEGAFNFEPSNILNSVELTNVEGIDILNFLIKWNEAIDATPSTYAIKNTYKCNLSFDVINLPTEITHSNGTKENGIAWLNRIKKEFGTDINGKPNFNISKGVIKVTGKLDEEKYYLLIDSLYEGTSIRVWDDDFFKSVSAAHFDAEEASVFIQAKVNGESISSKTLASVKVVAGAQIEFTAIVFPVSAERNIIYTPYFLRNGMARNWQVDTSEANTFNYNFGGRNQNSIFSYNPTLGTAKLNLYEYTEFSTDFASSPTITLPIDIASQEGDERVVLTDVTNAINVIFETAKKPTNSDFRLYKNNEEVVLSVGDKVDSAQSDIKYILEIPDAVMSSRGINIDFKDVSANITDPSCGEIRSELKTYEEGNEEGKPIGKQYILLTYSPKINNTNKLFNIDTTVTLNDKTSSTILVSFTIQLLTKNITNIVVTPIEGANYTITEVEDGYVFETYIKQTSEATKRYRFNVDLGDYNVGIEKMNIAAIERNQMVQLPTPTKIGKVFNEFEFVVPSLENSFYEQFTAQISITDEFQNEITKDILVKVGLYYPDLVQVFKSENDGSAHPDETEMQSLALDILSGDTTTIYSYKLHIYSNINGTPWYWVYDNTTTGEYYLDATGKPVQNENIVEFDKTVYNDLPTFKNAVRASYNVILELGNNSELLTSVPSDDDLVKKFSIKNNEVRSEENVTISCTLIVTGNNTHTSRFVDGAVTSFKATKNGACGKDGLWRNLPSNHVYIMDNQKRFYTYNGFPTNNPPTPVCLVYVYEDNNAQKQVITIDHTLLYDKTTKKARTFYYWQLDSTFAISDAVTNNFGFYSGVNNNGQFGGRTNLLFTLNGGLNTNNLGDQFKQLARYYSFICSPVKGSNRDKDNVTVTINGGSNASAIEGYNNDYVRAAEAICNDPSKMSFNFLDEDMVFYYNDYYYKTYGLSFNGRPLSMSEVNILVNNVITSTSNFETEFNECFRAIVDNPVANPCKEYIFDSTKYSTTTDTVDNFDTNGDIITNIETINRKEFWVLDIFDSKSIQSTIISNSNENELKSTTLRYHLRYECYLNKDKNLQTNSLLFTTPEQNIGNKVMNSHNKLYCLFGPQL